MVGGVSPKLQICTMTPDAVAGEVTAALADTGGVQMVIAPGYSISPGTPAENPYAAKTAVQQ